jgi:hypothetical protein
MWTLSRDMSLDPLRGARARLLCLRLELVRPLDLNE